MKRFRRRAILHLAATLPTVSRVAVEDEQERISIMKPNSAIWSSVVATVIAAATLGTPVHADVIMDWNAQSDAIVAQKQIQGVAHARTQTLLHLAMFEAVK